MLLLYDMTERAKRETNTGEMVREMAGQADFIDHYSYPTPTIILLRILYITEQNRKILVGRGTREFCREGYAEFLILYILLPCGSKLRH